ncbi:MAG: ethylbenzene dehydrogenase-related protein [Deferrisomatales bacterium]|nr:ethylbenzene dehydrogenase-related protein [Deferrisomatales bacterium]
MRGGRRGAALCALLLAGALLGGCQLELDGLYALRLDHEPAEVEWRAAVPLRLLASGGRTSRPGDGDVDGNMVHASTASCHHGTKVPPVQVDLRAFYTAERLYLRVTWVDPTEDLGPSWRWDEAGWTAGSSREDGLGLLWGTEGRGFSCFASCHLEDWRMADPRAFADYRMAAPKGEVQDFWIWKAGRGGNGGMVEDARLNPEGRAGDVPGELYVANSLRSRNEKPNPFGAGDVPWRAPDPDPTARAPAYLPRNPTPGWVEVDGSGGWVEGRWEVTLSRALVPLGMDDREFREGGEYLFGVAVLDGVEKDHLAVPAPVRLILVSRSTLAGDVGRLR